MLRSTVIVTSINSRLRLFSTKSSTGPQQLFKHFLVVDFEATCEDGQTLDPQEIIEFPVLKVNSATFDIEATFHRYVRPEIHPQLTPFCSRLTGIVQEMLVGQKNLIDTLKDFNSWMVDEQLLNEAGQLQHCAFVTCGDWDFQSCLFRQLRFLSVPMPPMFHRWINVKKPFYQATKVWPKGLAHMLQLAKGDRIGRLHSGIDDAKNIAALMAKLSLDHKIVFRVTSSLNGL